MTWQVKPGLEYRRLGAEGVILDADAGLFHRLPPDLATAWEALTGDVGHSVADAMITVFASLGLVVSAGAKPPPPPCRTTPPPFITCKPGTCWNSQKGKCR